MAVYDDWRVKGEEIYDNTEHWIDVIKQQQCQKQQERETKEKKRE